MIGGGRRSQTRHTDRVPAGSQRSRCRPDYERVGAAGIPSGDLDPLMAAVAPFVLELGDHAVVDGADLHDHLDRPLLDEHVAVLVGVPCQRSAM